MPCEGLFVGRGGGRSGTGIDLDGPRREGNWVRYRLCGVGLASVATGPARGEVVNPEGLHFEGSEIGDGCLQVLDEVLVVVGKGSKTALRRVEAGRSQGQALAENGRSPIGRGIAAFMHDDGLIAVDLGLCGDERLVNLPAPSDGREEMQAKFTCSYSCGSANA